jgi:hypothetical protein
MYKIIKLIFQKNNFTNKNKIKKPEKVNLNNENLKLKNVDFLGTLLQILLLVKKLKSSNKVKMDKNSKCIFNINQAFKSNIIPIILTNLTYSIKVKLQKL